MCVSLTLESQESKRQTTVAIQVEPLAICVLSFYSLAPEVLCRFNHSFVSDFYAVGVIAY